MDWQLIIAILLVIIRYGNGRYFLAWSAAYVAALVFDVTPARSSEVPVSVRIRASRSSRGFFVPLEWPSGGGEDDVAFGVRDVGAGADVADHAASRAVRVAAHVDGPGAAFRGYHQVAGLDARTG